MNTLNLGEPEKSQPEARQRTQRYSTVVKAGGTATDGIGRVLWVGVLIGATLGLLNFLATRLTASEISAPQLAALAAESLAISVVPYVLARAWDEVCRPPRWQ